MIASPIATRAMGRDQDYMTDPLREPLRMLVETEQLVVLLGTGSPQLNYAVSAHVGAPTIARKRAALAQTKFGLHVKGGEVCVRDGYDPMRWNPRTPRKQTFAMRDGYYAVHALWTEASGGTLDADMVIALWFERRTRKVPGSGWPYLAYRVRAS
jgi:hypothetical protein